MIVFRSGLLFGLIALLLLAACTPGEPTPTPTAITTVPFEESALAQKHGGLVTVIIGQVVQKTREQEEPSPTDGSGCPCTERYGFWRVKVERYLANPQPYDEITYKAIEETTNSDGTTVHRMGSQPSLPREGERAVFFLKRRILSQYPLLTGDTYGGFQALKRIKDGFVDVAPAGGIYVPEWVPLDEFVDSIVAMASQSAVPPTGASVVAVTDLVNCYPGPVDLLEYPRSTAIPEPNIYCGTVTVNGAPVADGTIVEAVVDGTVCDTVQATGGRYRATVVSPHCGKPGDIVYFRVAGRWAPQAGRVMIPFMGWALDLSVGSEGAPTSTPIPSPS